MQQATEVTKLIPLNSVKEHPRNYRSHTESQIVNLVGSLRRFGQVRGIVVQDQGDGTYLTIAGHGITKAARRLDWQEIKAEILPQSWSPEQLSGYLLADNYHSQHARDDSYLLAELFQEQVDAGYDLSTLGSSEKDLRQLFMIVQNQHEVDFLEPFLKTQEERREDHKEVKERLKESGRFDYPETVQESTHPTENTNITWTVSAPSGSTAATSPSPPIQPSFFPEKLPVAEQFFPMTYSFTSDQRRLVLQCINLIKERIPGITSTDALVKICDEWSRVSETWKKTSDQ